MEFEVEIRAGAGLQGSFRLLEVWASRVSETSKRRAFAALQIAKAGLKARRLLADGVNLKY